MPRALQTEAREELLVQGFTFVARASSRARQHLCVWVMPSHQKRLMKGFIGGFFVQKTILAFHFHMKLDDNSFQCQL